MTLTLRANQIFSCALILSLLTSCYRPPYNNFKPDKPVTRKVLGGAAVGVGVGAIAGSMTANLATGIVAGGVIGGAVGAVIGLQKESKPHIRKELKKCDIQYIQYGDTHTLIIPVDKYFIFNSARLNENRYMSLLNIIKLLRFYPESPIYVAGFSDNVGTRYHKNELSQAQAETMMTYLWANNIAAKRLKAEGYGEKDDIADNNWIHGSAMNRRIEIQWFSGITPLCCKEPAVVGVMK